MKTLKNETFNLAFVLKAFDLRSRYAIQEGYQRYFEPLLPTFGRRGCLVLFSYGSPCLFHTVLCAGQEVWYPGAVAMPDAGSRP